MESIDGPPDSTMSQSPPLTSSSWPWLDALDALLAAPAHHELCFENDRVRVVRTRIPAGDVVPLHTHRWGGVAYILSRSDFVRRDQDGKVVFDSREAGDGNAISSAQWIEPLPPHTVENVGTATLSVLTVELKDPA